MGSDIIVIRSKNGHSGSTSMTAHMKMREDFKKRFIVSTILTIPIVILSPSIQEFLGFKLVFPGNLYALWILSTVVYVYGGYPFMKDMMDEMCKKLPGMKTLISVTITVAYFYSSAVIFILPGKNLLLGISYINRCYASWALG